MTLEQERNGHEHRTVQVWDIPNSYVVNQTLFPYQLPYKPVNKIVVGYLITAEGVFFPTVLSLEVLEV